MKPLGPEDAFVTLPDGQQILYRDGNHTYRRVDEEGSTPLKSVSSLVSRVDGGHSDGLVQWAWNLGAEGKPWKEERDRKGNIGTSVQGAVPDLADFPEEQRGYIQAICGWWLDDQPEAVDQEFIVAHPTLDYAGRVDLLVEIKGEKWLVDLKTSNKLSPKFHHQMGLYALAMDACGIGRPDRLALLHAMPDGEWLFVESHVKDEHVALIPSCVHALTDFNKAQRAVDLNG
jgi:hypothetical protein